MGLVYTRRKNECLREYYIRILQERPVTFEAIALIRELIESEEIHKDGVSLECLSMKCLLAYIDGNVEGRGMVA